MLDSTAMLVMSLPSTPVPFDHFKAEFLAQHRAQSAPATLAKYEQLCRLLEGLGVETTGQLTLDLVARFIASRPAAESPFTTRGLLMSLRSICYDAEARRYVQVSPFRLRKLSRLIRAPKPEGVRHQGRDEIRRVFDLMRRDTETKQGWPQWRARRLYALTATVALTGLRAREAQRLWVADLDLVNGIINLKPRTKSGLLKTDASAQPVILPKALKPILTDWLRHRLDARRGFDLPTAAEIPWVFPGSTRTCAWVGGSSGVRPMDCLRAAATRAGVPRMTFQSLRRSFATAAEAAGIPQAMITRQCRHSSEETTKRWYQQRDLDSLRDAVEGFDY